MLSQHIARTERETLQFRLLALLVVVGGLFVLRQRIPVVPAVSLALIYLAYSIALRAWIIPRFAGPYVVYAMILTDGIALTVASYLLGGGATIFIILFPLSVVYYAIYLGYAGSFLAATVMSLCVVGLADVEGRLLSGGAALAGQVFLFFLLAGFAGYLGQRRIHEGQERKALEELLDLEAGAKAVLDVALRVCNSLDLGDVVEEIQAEVPRVIGLPHCLISVFDDRSEPLTGETSAVSLDQQRTHEAENLLEGLDPESLEAQALSRMEPLSVAITEVPKSAWPDWALQLDLDSLLFVPLVFRGRAIGVLGAGGNEARPATEVEMRLAEAIGAVAALAIGNALIYEEAQKRMEELVQELETALRSIGDLRQAKSQEVLEIDGLVLDPARHQALVGGHPIDVSATEWDVLWLLAQNANMVVEYDHLLRVVWPRRRSRSKNLVNVCIHRLRTKIEDDVSSPKRIRSVRGLGYMLCGQSEH